MPTVQPSSSSVDFGICGPGAQPSQTVDLIIDNAGAFPVTVSLMDDPNGPFIAQLYATRITRGPGGISQEKQYLTITDTDASATILDTYPYLESPLPTTETATVDSSGTLEEPAYHIQIDFTTPALPVFGDWTNTLIISWENVLTISWEGGSTQINLSAATARLAVVSSESQPVQITPGATVSALIEVALLYSTQDAAPIDAIVGPGIQTVPGLSFPTTTLILAAEYYEVPGNIERRSGLGLGVGNPLPESVLGGLRRAFAAIPVTAAESVEPGNGRVLGFEATCGILPSQIGKANGVVTFDIQYPPVTITISNDQPIYLEAGTSLLLDPLKLNFQIDAPGASTTLSLGPASISGAPNVGLTWPLDDSNAITFASDMQIGGGESSAQMLVTSLNSDAPAATLKITVPWSAYGGNKTGTVDVTLYLLALPKPPPRDVPVIHYENGRVWGQGFQSNLPCTVRIIDETAGFLPAGPWGPGNIQRPGIAIQSPCDGTPNQWFEIQASNSAGQSATLKIYC